MPILTIRAYMGHSKDAFLFSESKLYDVKVPREIDFVVTSGSKRTYIQSAYAMLTEEKRETELRPFALTGDSFPKIIVRKDCGKRWYDDKGILNISLIDFLLDKELI